MEGLEVKGLVQGLLRRPSTRQGGGERGSWVPGCDGASGKVALGFPQSLEIPLSLVPPKTPGPEMVKSCDPVLGSARVLSRDCECMFEGPQPPPLPTNPNRSQDGK
jgi:hypothetical protein